MKRRNCWEVTSCGRQPGGSREHELGVCPAAVSGEHDGVNRGTFRGRFCWQVPGTFCDGEASGPFSEKMMRCLACPFLQTVQDDESVSFVLVPAPGP